MDKLTLKSLQYKARHGYYEEERKSGNRFEVDLEFSLDLKQAGRKDYLSKTVNYEEAETTVREVMESPPLKLIETLAFRIGEALFDQFPRVHKLRVRVRKLEPPMKTTANYSEVSISWQR